MRGTEALPARYRPAPSYNDRSRVALLIDAWERASRRSGAIDTVEMLSRRLSSASATLAALTRGAGIYNVVDDEPVVARDWIPYLASVLGAKPPRQVPAWLARLLAGKTAVTMMTQGRGGINDKAKSELNWRPIYASWRDGFKHELG